MRAGKDIPGRQTWNWEVVFVLDNEVRALDPLMIQRGKLHTDRRRSDLYNSLQTHHGPPGGS